MSARLQAIPGFVPGIENYSSPDVKERRVLRIGVIGGGYVGLVAGTCLAEMGNSVTIVDTDRAKVDMLFAGQSPIYEPGLDELRKRNQANGRLIFSYDVVQAVKGADVVFIAVGTPPGENGAVDMSIVEKAVADVAKAMNGYCVLVLKSTVPPGSNRRIEALVRENTAHAFDVVSNPEFLKEGAAVHDFMHPDRVVIGARSDKARNIMRQVYNPFFRTGFRLMETDPESAEMIKYTSNIMLAARISLMNELAGVCQAVGADVEKVRVGVGLDKRIGASFLFPGLGYGGSCFPKDVQAVVALADKVGIRADICRAVDGVNARQRDYLMPFVKHEFGDNWSGRTFAVLGLAYKPSTDDVRESPALAMIRKMLDAGAVVNGYDPEAGSKAKQVIPALQVANSMAAAVAGADAVFLCTEWNEFRNLDWPALAKVMKSPVVFDGRNIYACEEMAEFGFTYYSIGRAPVRPRR